MPRRAPGDLAPGSRRRWTRRARDDLLPVRMALGSLYRCFILAARARGADLSAAVASTGLAERALLEPTTRLSPEVGFTFIRALLRAADEPALGLEAAALFRLEDLDLLGYLVKHAASLTDVFTLIARYARLLGDTAACEVEQQRDVVVLRIGRSGGRKLATEASDFCAAVVTRLVREFSSVRNDPLEVQLPRARLSDDRAFRRFFRAPLKYEAECATLIYPAAPCALSREGRDPRLVDILRRQADRELEALPPDEAFDQRLRALMAKRLFSGTCRLSELAKDLGMSERTLRRRLREAGTGYRELIDDIRRERAVQLAEQGELGVTEMAMRLGFDDVTAFSRAFRRWTGVLPSAYARGTSPRFTR